MLCQVCRAERAANELACSRCRTPVPRVQGAEQTGHSRLRRFLWHFAVTASLVLLTASLHLIDVLPIRLPLRTSPLATEAVDRANDRAAVIALLGEPGRPGWFVKGYVRTYKTGWGEARVWLPVSGPTGRP